MAKNAYLEKQAAMRQGYFTAGLQTGRQQILDMVSLVLRDPEIMGKDTLGKERLRKIYAKLTEIANEYHTAFTADPEADYWQDALDRHLREVWGDELQTFYERYPYVKKFDYSRTRKEWR